MKCEVRTEKYEFSTGKKPSGFGTWAFGTKDEQTVWFFNGKYSEAKKQAIAKANEILPKFTTIYVLP